MPYSLMTEASTFPSFTCDRSWRFAIYLRMSIMMHAYAMYITQSIGVRSSYGLVASACMRAAVHGLSTCDKLQLWGWQGCSGVGCFQAAQPAPDTHLVTAPRCRATSHPLLEPQITALNIENSGWSQSGPAACRLLLFTSSSCLPIWPSQISEARPRMSWRELWYIEGRIATCL